MEWEKLFSGKYFISDLGTAQMVKSDDGQVSLMQYAAWAPIEDGTKHQIVAISCDLDLLMQKYDIPPERVCTVA